MIDFFIHRPIFASAIAIIMTLAGGICYFLLPISQFPDVTPPQIVVAANYPGASAQVVADTVTTPLEQQINGVPGMLYMTSTSSNDGSSRIIISFEVAIRSTSPHSTSRTAFRRQPPRFPRSSTRPA